jgi:hypothetical protein
MMDLLMYDYGNQYMVMKSKNPKGERDTSENQLEPTVTDGEQFI